MLSIQIFLAIISVFTVFLIQFFDWPIFCLNHLPVFCPKMFFYLYVKTLSNEWSEWLH